MRDKIVHHLPMVHTWHTVGARSAWAALRCEIQFSLAGITVAQNGQRKLALGRAGAAGLPGVGVGALFLALAAVTGMSLATVTALLMEGEKDQFYTFFRFWCNLLFSTNLEEDGGGLLEGAVVVGC